MQYEAQEQAALFEWAAYQAGEWPELALMFAIPNGGYRNKPEAARLKAEGVKAGVPDIFLPVPGNGCAGLFIEMKHGTNRPSKEQLRYLDALMEQGYGVAVCYGFEQAVTTITGYLNGRQKGRANPAPSAPTRNGQRNPASHFEDRTQRDAKLR